MSRKVLSKTVDGLFYALLCSIERIVFFGTGKQSKSIVKYLPFCSSCVAQVLRCVERYCKRQFTEDSRADKRV